MKKNMSRREALRWMALAGVASLVACRSTDRPSPHLASPSAIQANQVHTAVPTNPPPIRLIWPPHTAKIRLPSPKPHCGQLAEWNASSRMATM